MFAHPASGQKVNVKFIASAGWLLLFAILSVYNFGLYLSHHIVCYCYRKQHEMYLTAQRLFMHGLLTACSWKVCSLWNKDNCRNINTSHAQSPEALNSLYHYEQITECIWFNGRFVFVDVVEMFGSNFILFRASSPSPPSPFNQFTRQTKEKLSVSSFFLFCFGFCYCCRRIWVISFIRDKPWCYCLFLLF